MVRGEVPAARVFAGLEPVSSFPLGSRCVLALGGEGKSYLFVYHGDA